MTENGQEKIVAFDTLFTTNQIQILKILLAYLEPAQQKLIAVYIKFLELQYTITFFQKHSSYTENFLKEENFDTGKLCDEILPFCNPYEQEIVTNLKNVYRNFTNMQEMMEMVQMMKDLFPDGENLMNGDPSAIFSGLPGFADMFGSQENTTGMDMSQLFDMINNSQ